MICLLLLLVRAVVILGSFSSPAIAVFEPCHLLCSNEAGRVEARSVVISKVLRRFSLRLETLYVSPRGHYEEGHYQSLPEGAAAHIFEFLPAVSYRPSDNLQFNAGIPWEYNSATNVVLPTLHPTEGTTHEFAPGGIFASIHWLIPTPTEWGLESWFGLGYRLSSPAGTVDVSRDIANFPDKAIEGLGAGTDDIYWVLRNYIFADEAKSWRLGVGAELRAHMLPRWQRLFATTVAYQLWIEHFLFPRWSVLLRVSGFYTNLRVLEITQRSALIMAPNLAYAATEDMTFAFGLSGEVPGTSLNANVLQTIAFHFSIATVF